jgi:Ca2+-binding RTX toxin-like protein
MMGEISTGDGADVILNTGLISGNVNMGAGADKISTDLGHLNGFTLNGGVDYDTLVNLDQVTRLHMVDLAAMQFEAYTGSAASELVSARNMAGFGAYVLLGAGADLFDGSAQADFVDGGADLDVLYGRGGADTLIGGNDGDWLQGGTGADKFDYNSLTDSTVNGQDYIADFKTADGDKIDLHDALVGLAAPTFNAGYGTRHQCLYLCPRWHYLSAGLSRHHIAKPDFGEPSQLGSGRFYTLEAHYFTGMPAGVGISIHGD